MTTRKNSIKISLEIATRILGDALNNPFQEICGLISYDKKSDTQKSYPIRNVATSPNTHFEMDSTQLIATTKQVRNLKHKMFAIYHSHPNGNITPSSQDIQQYEYHDLLYIIISPGNDGILNLAGYWIHQNKSVEPVTLYTNT